MVMYYGLVKCQDVSAFDRFANIDSQHVCDIGSYGTETKLNALCLVSCRIVWCPPLLSWYVEVFVLAEYT